MLMITNVVNNFELDADREAKLRLCEALFIQILWFTGRFSTRCFASKDGVTMGPLPCMLCIVLDIFLLIL